MTKGINKLKFLAHDEQSKEKAIDVSRDLLYLVNNALEGSNHPRLSKAVAIGSALYTLSMAAKGIYDLYRGANQPDTYTIKISESDIGYSVVMKWIMSEVDSMDLLALGVTTSVTRSLDDGERNAVSRFIGEPETRGGGESSVRLTTSLTDEVSQAMTVRGHTVYVVVPPAPVTAETGGYSQRSLQIVCSSPEARRDVMDELESRVQQVSKAQPRMFLTTRWGDWRTRSDIQTRARDSVVLKEGQMDEILDHLDTFLNNKAAYQKADIPYRTGIMLHGNPGSGKSSTALAIANELKMDVYIVSLSSLSNDQALGEAFGTIPSNSIIILEDIDVARAAKDRDGDDDNGVTMTGLLNVLDGFQSPVGVITIMTTNRLEVLDPAIRRPGRVDLTQHLDCIDQYQLEGMCSYFMGEVPEDLPEITPADGITSADIMGVIRKHLPDFENASEDISEYIRERCLTKASV